MAISRAGDAYAKAIAHNALATVYLDAGRHADAAREYTKALKLDRRVLGIQNNLAYSYAERGEKLAAHVKQARAALTKS